MAKAKRSVRRDPSPITNRRLSDTKPGFSVSPSRPVGPPPYRPKPHPYPWPNPITDGRLFNPSRPKKAVVTFSGRPARVVAPPPSETPAGAGWGPSCYLFFQLASRAVVIPSTQVRCPLRPSQDTPRGHSGNW